MSYCVYIDLGDGDFIKPNFSKPPTAKMIEDTKKWALEMKAKNKEMKDKGICTRCEGKKTARQRDLDAPTFKLKDGPCPDCEGTGRSK